MRTEANAVTFDPYRLGRTPYSDPARGHGAGGPATKRVVVAYGFWVFLISDIILFAAFFASYAVLAGQTAGGPSGRQIFDLANVGLETACLLASSLTGGVAALAAGARNRIAFYAAMLVT